MNTQSVSHRVKVLHDILERGMRAKLFEQFSLIEQRVQQVRVVMEGITQTGVYNLQHHSDHLLDDIQILSLREKRENAASNDRKKKKKVYLHFLWQMMNDF